MKKNEKPIVPFLKWAGGKRWMIYEYPELFPTEYNRYIEPFLGSGAVFFSLKPKKAILSDLNSELIETYCAIRDDYNRVEIELKKHHRNHSKSYYYEIRSKRLRVSTTRASQFIYLNRTCWNGLYRVNLNGVFNVPIGTKTNVLLPTDNFQGISNILKRVRLMDKDFEPIIAKAKEGDLLFIDPPYTVKHNNNNFHKYNEHIFNWEDQIRLCDSLLAAKARGAKIILCNADNESVIELYKGIGKAFKLERFSRLAADPSKRQNTTELAIVNTLS